MLKLNYLLCVAILAAFHGNDHNNKASCDLLGDWSQVTLLIDLKGSAQPLVFPTDKFFKDQFLNIAQKVHNIYVSGNGNIDIDMDPTLSLSKKKLSYKGTKLGRYQLSDDCKTICLQKQKVQQNPDAFAQFKVLFRYENIIAVEQGKEVALYLKRDAANPFFVGNN